MSLPAFFVNIVQYRMLFLATTASPRVHPVGPVTFPTIPQNKKWVAPSAYAIVDLPPESPLQVGDLVAAGISHPCTTIDKWQLVPLVDDAYNVTGAIRTFF